MPSLSKSIFTSGRQSQTISMWLCRITVLQSSYPGVAPLRIITLPTSSTFVSKPRLSPKLFKYSIIFSSRFEGRGISLIFAKCSKTTAGFNSLLFIINVYFIGFLNLLFIFAVENCKASAKLIIYGENLTIQHVNNCYRNGFFSNKSPFTQKWHLLVAAYSRQ